MPTGDESSSGLSPRTEQAAPPPRGVFPPHELPPPQVVIRGSVQGGTGRLAARHLPLTLSVVLMLLSSWESR
uniref:Uncharacterized protein n=1 Tax=Knipowitschia caucasica TaxID=637954 RepID=A0AAV2KSW0_KNICA